MSDILRPHPSRKPPIGPVLFVVMDGIGVGRGDEGDAVARAYTPTLDWLRSLPSVALLRAHGTSVGMPSDADMGNSEVGHNAIGAGRVFEQGAKLVEQAIRSGSMFEGEVWRWLVDGVQRSGEPLHFIGLLSDGNVHSHINHLISMVSHAARDRVGRIRVHVLTDGRDVPGRSALIYIERLEAALADLRAQGFDYAIASGGGRMHVTMDRYEAEWGMVERGWDLHVRGHGRPFRSAREAVQTYYDEYPDTDDQYLPGFVIVGPDGQPLGPIRDGASVVLFNFRGDRALELTRAFEQPDFDKFDRSPRPQVRFAGMMQYDGDLGLPSRFLVAPPAIDRTMGELLARAGRRQLAIAETHKFGHVTYFWNGNRSEPFDPTTECYVEVASELAPLEQRPWMKCAEVTDALLEAVRKGIAGNPFDLVRLNYANGDMVGHTGDLRATILAVEAVDLCLARLVAATRAMEGVLIVTADHGNADQMFDGVGEQRTVRTSHSLNPVPLAIFDPREPNGGPALRVPELPGLSNLAATTLELLGFVAPEDYDSSLLAP
jgi:2,3-bisphosphoglycerate-independent phosphoglycerate mutase